MGRQRSTHTLIIISTFLAPALSSLMSLFPSFPAQGLKFPPVDDRKAPALTRGAGTRGPSCIEEDPVPLTSLMPTRNNWGQTLNPHPSLYWYLPPTTAKVGEFTLVDTTGKQIFSTQFDLPHQASVIALNLTTLVALEVDQYYGWSFTLVCNVDDRSQDMYVKGSLQRIGLEPSVKQQLSRTTEPLAQAQLLAQQGVWHDTLHTLAEIRSLHPAEWEELLASVNLPSEIAQAEIREVQLVSAGTDQVSSSLSNPY